jgi:type II secretory pathway component PulF
MNEPIPQKKDIGKSFGVFPKFFGRLSIQEKINFSRHLAMTIKAGLPVIQGLTFLQEQASSRTLSKIIDRLIFDVNNGRFLSDGLEEFRSVFGDFFINVVRVGESSGTLAQNLLYLADELKKAKDLRMKIRSAMVYPVIIMVATVGLVAFLTFFVLPKLLPVFAGMNVKLPPSTKFLISTVGAIQAYGLQVLGGVIVFFIAVKLILSRVSPVKYLFNLAEFYVPVFGTFLINVNMVNFSRILALLLKSGIRIFEALGITSKTFDNLVYRRLIIGAQEEMKKGGQLADYLLRHKRFFPMIFSQMVRVGENTGNLGENLAYLCEYYAEETDNKLNTLTSLLEPLLLLIMGLMVGFVAISIIVPIYSITQGISGGK